MWLRGGILANIYYWGRTLLSFCRQTYGIADGRIVDYGPRSKSYQTLPWIISIQTHLFPELDCLETPSRSRDVARQVFRCRGLGPHCLGLGLGLGLEII